MDKKKTATKESKTKNVSKRETKEQKKIKKYMSKFQMDMWPGYRND